MPNIKIVVPTPQTEDEYKNSQPYDTLTHIDGSFFPIGDIDIISRNKRGISQIYNEKLAEYSASENSPDFVIFMHDDVEIHDRYFIQKLQKAHQQYDVVGLAGATSQNYTNMPHGPAWHLCMNNRQKDGRGFVSHAIPKDVGGYPFPYINSSYFGPSPSEVVFIDGLMISFNLASWKKNPITFNEKYTFHHYDMSACVELKKSGFSIGVYPIYVIHYGLGEFQSDPLWHTLAAEFKKDYNTYLTII